MSKEKKAKKKKIALNLPEIIDFDVRGAELTAWLPRRAAILYFCFTVSVPKDHHRGLSLSDMHFTC